MNAKVKKTRRTVIQSLLFFNKIQFKLILAFIVPIAGIIILGIVSYNKASDSIIHNYETSIKQTMDMTGQYYKFSLGSIKGSFNEFYQSVELRDYYKGLYSSSPSEAQSIYNGNLVNLKSKTQASNKDLLDNMYILNDNKSILTTKAVQDKLYTAYSETEEGKKVLEDPKSYYWLSVNPEIDSILVSDSSKYALRLARKSTTSDVIYIADINRQELISTLNILDFGKGSYLALVLSDGVEIGSDSTDGKTNVFQQYYQEAVAGENISGLKYVDYNNQSYLFVYSKVEDTDLVVCSLIPRTIIISQVSNIKSITMIIVLIACIISTFLCYVTVSGIGNTMRHMRKQLKKVSGGDLTIQIQIKRRDEFSFLAQDITSMILNMKTLIQKVKDVGIELVSTIDLLANNSKTFISTTNNIQSAVGEIDAGIIQLDENSEDCLGQMAILSEKINLVHDNTDRISKITNSTGNAIDTGIHTMETLDSKVKDTAVITDRVISTIKILEEKTNQIGKIVEVINEISEQTNLLSLNATIEAARAGDSGKGFRVISNEMSKLSDNTLNSSKQIQRIINEILQNINLTVNTAKAAGEIVQSQTEALNNTAQSFIVMNQEIDAMMTETDEILKNAINMEQARKTTEDAIQSIYAVSEEITAASGSVSETVGSQIETVSLVDDTISKLIENADILKEAINRFIM